MKKVAVAIHATEDFDINVIKHLQNLDYIHVDVMDGKFVNNTMLNLDLFQVLNREFDIPIIAHMMVENPTQYIDKIINYVDIFLFHVEVQENIKEVIKKITDKKKSAGLVINPPTPISSLLSFLEHISVILVMGVNPGWSGQKFIEKTIDRVNELAAHKKQYQFEIDVDGGVNLENAKQLQNADILSSSSTILEAEDPNEVIKLLKTSDQN